MSEKVETHFKVPSTAKKGDVIEIKTLVTHPMVSGQTKDKDGKTIPREIINTFTCTYNGKQVFKMALEPAIAMNPYIAFTVKAEDSGTLDFTWVDDDGTVYKDQAKITVT